MYVTKDLVHLSSKQEASKHLPQMVTDFRTFVRTIIYNKNFEFMKAKNE